MTLSPLTPATFATPVDAFSTTIATAYTPGSGSMTLASAAGLGSPSPAAPVRITCLRAADQARSHYLVTAVAGNTLTVAVADGYADLAFAPGDAAACTANAPMILAIQSAIETTQVLTNQIVAAVNSGTGTGGAVTSVAGRTGAITLDEADVSGLTAGLAALAPLASPALTGDPTAPTPPTADNSTRLATTAYVQSQAFETASAVTTYVTGLGYATTAQLAGAISGLGLGSASTHAATDFDPAGSATAALASAVASSLQKAANLSDLASAATARGNLGLGSIATHAATDYLTPGGSGSGLTGLTGSQIAGGITGQAGTVATIAGLIAAGTNVAITGAGTAASPYQIAASGGGGSGSTSPGGSSGQIQFNNAGAFGGSVALVASSTVALTITAQDGASNILDVWDNSGNLGLYLSSTGAVSIGGRIDEDSTYRGISMGYGPQGDTPRVLFCNGVSSENWQIDNYNGTFRWFTPSTVRMTLDSDGNLDVSNNLAVNNNLSAGSLTLPATSGQPTSSPAAGTVEFDPATGLLWIRGNSGWISK